MLQSISWQTFFTFIAVTLIGYYMVIGYLYYRGDLLAVFRQLARTGKPGFLPAAGPGIPGDNTATPAQLSSFHDELKAYTTASGTSCNRSEFFYGLGKLLHKYHALKQTGFSENINAVIIAECLENCNVSIDRSEIEVLWNG
jgi:hypothetical protein